MRTGMHWKFVAASASFVLIASGCATQDQLRKTEAQTAEAGYEVKGLRSGVDSNAAAISELRAQVKHTQDSTREMEAALAEMRTRNGATKTQLDNAQAASKELLASLVAVREEQRRQLAENGAAFSDIRRKSAEMDSRLQAQQRLLEQNAVAFNEATRRLGVVEIGLLEATRRSAALEAKAKTGQETDEALTRQLTALNKQVTETRALVSSEGMLQLMREVEDIRRNSASLRGSLDELQKAQSDSAAQVKNFYLDLDTRIRALKQSATQRPSVPDAAAAPGAPVNQ
jgi:chromosome segregation ATPase